MNENVCPPPKDLNLIDHAMIWLNSISQEDANKFIGGMNLNSILVLYKHFPDNEIVKQVLQSRI